MKKILLVSAMMMASVAAVSAQTLAEKPMEKVPVVLTRNISMEARQVNPAAFAQKSAKPVVARAYEDGVYFTRDKGLLYLAADDKGNGFYVPYLVYPPYYLAAFADKSADTSKSKWLINGEDVSSYVKDGVFYWGYTSFYSQYDYQGKTYDATYYTPTLQNGGVTYEIGSNSRYYDNYGAALMKVGAMDNYLFFDEKSGVGYGQGSLQGTDKFTHLFGTGSLTSKTGATYTSLGTVEFYPAPASPLYVERVRVSTMDGSKTPIAEGKELTMCIMNVETDAEGNETLGNDTIALMTATASDVNNYYSYDASSYGMGIVYYNYINFQNKTIDPLFQTEVVEPFTLSDKFAVVLTGVEQEGVNVNILGSTECAEDSTLTGASMLLTDGEESFYSYVYGTGLSQEIAFKGCFDFVETMDKAELTDGSTLEHFNVLKVPAAGTTDGSGVTNYGYPSISYTQALINFDMFDEEENGNYTITDVPDWINFAASQFDVDDEDTEKYAAVGVASCEALPDGETGRYAVCYLEGKGYKSSYPIIILQGDVDLATAVNNVKSNAKVMKTGNVYNLNGQRVSKAVKGLLIQDGKKFYNK